MTEERKLRKRFYTIAAALGLAVGSFGIAGAATGSNAPTDPAVATAEDDAQEPGYAGSIQAPAEDPTAPEGTEDEAAEAAALQGLATITADEASAAALEAVPGEVAEVELDNENGSVVYSVEIIDASGAEIDVKVDAGNGSVLDQQADDETDDHADTDDVEHESEHEGENDVDQGN